MAEIAETLRRAVGDLDAMRVDYALVGGIAVSLRTRPRFTRDVDLSLAVRSDRQAERVIRELIARGYRPVAILEHERTGRLVTARFLIPESDAIDPDLDLIFASSGIEQEIVADATWLAIPNVGKVRVARVGHLIAMKVLSATTDRPNDAADLQALFAAATPVEWRRASASLALITKRRCHRRRNLSALLEEWRRHFAV